METPYQIWIAEDNPADVYLIEEALRQQQFGYRLTSADNGEDMLKMIAKLDRDPSQTCPVDRAMRFLRGFDRAAAAPTFRPS
jgi:CheY-like chemotaxis protein